MKFWNIFYLIIILASCFSCTNRSPNNGLVLYTDTLNRLSHYYPENWDTTNTNSSFIFSAIEAKKSSSDNFCEIVTVTKAIFHEHLDTLNYLKSLNEKLRNKYKQEKDFKSQIKQNQKGLMYLYFTRTISFQDLLINSTSACFVRENNFFVINFSNSYVVNKNYKRICEEIIQSFYFLE